MVTHFSPFAYEAERVTGASAIATLGGAEVIVVDNCGVLISASNPRKDGIALGY